MAPPLEQAIPACELLSCAVIGAVAGFQIAVIIEPLSGVLFVCRVQLVRQSDKFKASIVVCAYNARVGDRAVVVFPDFPLRVGDKDFTVGLFLRCSGGGVLSEYQEDVGIRSFSVSVILNIFLSPFFRVVIGVEKSC